MILSAPRTFTSAVVLLALSWTLVPASGEGAVQHVVLLQFKEEAPPTRVREILRDYTRLATTLPGITGFQWGVNNSPEGLADGFTHGFLMTFEDAAARDAYLEHPEAVAFADNARLAIEKVFTFDFDNPSAPSPAEPGRVHHLVFFKYKEGVGETEVKSVADAFSTLPRKVSGLIHYQAGSNNSTAAYAHLAQGFHHAFVLTFANERLRNDYLPHPAHKEFVSKLLPLLDRPLVLDFTVTPSSRSLFVTTGLEPYRVYQRNESGTATVKFAGVAEDDGPIEARLRAGRRTVRGFDWRTVGRAAGGRFDAVLENVPTGGEYTVEVRRRDALGNVAAHTEVANILVGDIWILAGQSNMQGVGDLVDVEESSPHVHCFTMAHRWELAEEPLHWLIDSPDPVHSGRRLENLDEEGRRRARSQERRSRTKGAGLGLPFATEYHARTGVPVGLIAAAHGGTSMAQWEPAGRTAGGQTLYGSMYKQVMNAGGKVKGVLWYQGESDANPQAVPEFATRFKNLVAAFRRDFDSPQLPFYYVQIGRFVIDRAGDSWDRIQELQRLAEAEIPHTAVVSVIDLPLDDLIHVGTDGLKRAGRRLAKIADAELFGEEQFERGPRLESVRAVADGRIIRVRFASVNGGLLPATQVRGFGLYDDEGAEIRAIYDAYVDPGDRSTVVLKLQNPAPEDAVLHYGKGLDPACNLVDEEDMAALATGPVAIER